MTVEQRVHFHEILELNPLKYVPIIITSSQNLVIDGRLRVLLIGSSIFFVFRR